MPEGDSVWRTARKLHRALAGQPLTGAELRVPAHSTADLAGRRTIEVVPRGKHLLHRIEGGLTLHSHLRMDGAWLVQPVARRHFHAGRHTVRALLWTGRIVAVGDALGMLDLVATARESRVVGHLGPDLLDPGFETELALANVRADPDRPLVEACLDQRNVAGMGTIFTSEPMFLHGINPWTPVGQLDPDLLAELLATTRRLLVLSCRLGRTTVTGRVETTGTDGWVFARVGLPCKRCGGTIRLASVGPPPNQRVICYCPACQGGLAPTDDGRPQSPLGHDRRRYD